MDISATKPCLEGGRGGGRREDGAPSPRPLEVGMSFTEEAVSLLTTNSLLARSLLGTMPAKPTDAIAAANRRKREFTPDEKKDSSYWDKRKKNNEAAKRSREKRRVNDMVLEQRVIGLLEENGRLKAELLALKFRFGLIKDPTEMMVTQSSAPPLYCMTDIRSPFVPAPEAGYVTRCKVFPAHDQPSASSLGVEQQESAVVSEDSGISTPGSSNVGSPVFFEDHLGDQGKFSPNREYHLEGPLSSHSDGEADLGRGGENKKPTRSQELMELVRCLPHKLRFKMGAGVEEMFQTSVGNRTVCEQQGREQGPGYYTNSSTPHLPAASLVSPAWKPHGGFPSDESRAPINNRYLQEAAQANIPHAPSDHTKTSPNVLRNQLASLSAEVAQLKKIFSQQRCTGFN
ncbi:nuclear factor interleukin-3-regulated protein-like isoform X2 [Amblyraja radiata]|uniref:nuclear factor interleukin-3-regulated protein-like isoform X2 n=1 Tax=Amblyraja radiata TaxID=386614 RepID=UPI001403811E|nr:nuclear factor interleukin-3-regulated protein-like isoform X2 [Amblyraja radiata]